MDSNNSVHCKELLGHYYCCPSHPKHGAAFLTTSFQHRQFVLWWWGRDASVLDTHRPQPPQPRS